MIAVEQVDQAVGAQVMTPVKLRFDSTLVIVGRAADRVPAGYIRKLRRPPLRHRRTRRRCLKCRRNSFPNWGGGGGKIAEVRKVAWSSVVHTTGTVDWDADHTTQAITQVNGPITKLLVDLGARVTMDQPLLYVSSPDVAGAISTYKKAYNREDYAKKTLDRSKDLMEHKVIATKDLEAAEQDYNDARARRPKATYRR